MAKELRKKASNSELTNLSPARHRTCRDFWVLLETNAHTTVNRTLTAKETERPSTCPRRVQQQHGSVVSDPKSLRDHATTRARLRPAPAALPNKQNATSPEDPLHSRKPHIQKRQARKRCGCKPGKEETKQHHRPTTLLAAEPSVQVSTVPCTSGLLSLGLTLPFNSRLAGPLRRNRSRPKPDAATKS